MLSEDRQRLLEAYNRGLASYKARDFRLALDSFLAAQAIDPQDGPTNLYIERCKTYLIDPPPSDWDGVYTMTTK